MKTPSPLGLFLDIAEQFFGPKPDIVRKVLILEDDPNEGDILCGIVRDAGFEPDLFVSRRDAERSMDKCRYAAGIFDLKLQDGRGDAAQHIFQRKFPGAPTLIASGDQESILRIIQQGVSTSVVWKGNDFRAMEEAVKKLLQPPKPTQPTTRWTTREVILFLILLSLAFAAGFTLKLKTLHLP
jgi:DNA-binding NtrC family response regulator